MNQRRIVQIKLFEPKIIVDSDWKSQAQAEKQRLAAKEQQAKPAAALAGAGAPGPEGEEYGPADFVELVRLLASQALLYLGAIPDPQTGRALLAPDMAKFNIDLLGILEQKTKGNLSEQESKVLTSTLYELRLQFVEISKAIDKAIADGRIKEVPGHIPAGGKVAVGKATPASASPIVGI